MTDPSDGSAFKYRAFISYSHKDVRWAKWLQNALENYRIPARLVGTITAMGVVPQRLGVFCRDRSDLSSGPDINAHIKEALTQSTNLIVVCSPSASASRWVNQEIEMFIRLGRAERIFCLIVQGKTNASDISGREAEECLAPALRFVCSENGQVIGRRPEPMAANARAGQDGRLNAKLKLVAALLGIDFDVLKQREQRRRIQRLVALTSTAVLVMIITTALAIEAVRERNRAVIERQSAERRQRQAEELVDFMLGDLNDKLRQVQRLDILEAVDNRAGDYFQSLPILDVTDQTIAQRANALKKIGRVRADQGKLPAALESYRSAAALGQELLHRAPQDPERQAGYADTLNFIGNAYWFQGDLKHALENFQQSEALLEVASQKQRSDSLRSELASARTNEGRVLEAQGDLSPAKDLYEAVLVTFSELASQDPNGDKWQPKLADAYDSLGKLDLEQGKLTQAIAAYRDVRRIREQLSAKTPSDRALQEGLLVSNAILGRALALCGAGEAAASYVRNSVLSARTLVTYDATQVDWQEELADYSRLLAEITRGLGLLDTAEEHDTEALKVLAALVATDGTNATWRRELANAQIEQGRLRLRRGDLSDADRLLNSALNTVVEERHFTPEDRNLRLMEAQAHLVLGQIAAQRNESGSARDHFSRARAAIERPARVGADPNFLATWSSALLLLNDASARPVIDELVSMGYQTPDFQALLLIKKQPYALKPIAQRCGPDGETVTENLKIR